MSRKIKIPDSILHHEDVHVRCMLTQILAALDAAKRGDVKDMATFVRLAGLFEAGIPAEIRL